MGKYTKKKILCIHVTRTLFQHHTVKEIEKLFKKLHFIISLDSSNSRLGLSLIVFQSKLIVSVTDRTPEQISQPKSKHLGNNLTRLFSHISEQCENVHDDFFLAMNLFYFSLSFSGLCECACVWICVCISWITCLYPLSPILTGLSRSTQQQTRNKG